MKLVPVQVGRQGVGAAALHMPCECRLMDHLHPMAKLVSTIPSVLFKWRGGRRKMLIANYANRGKTLQEVYSMWSPNTLLFLTYF